MRKNICFFKKAKNPPAKGPLPDARLPDRVPGQLHDGARAYPALGPASPGLPRGVARPIVDILHADGEGGAGGEGGAEQAGRVVHLPGGRMGPAGGEGRGSRGGALQLSAWRNRAKYSFFLSCPSPKKSFSCIFNGPLFLALEWSYGESGGPFFLVLLFSNYTYALATTFCCDCCVN